MFDKIKNSKVEHITTLNKREQVNFIINDVKVTFFKFPYEIPLYQELKGIIKMPDLLTLAAMKAFALRKRAKWKDYVDLYFLLKDFHSLREVSDKAAELFQGEFNEKLFRVQLTYFKDISYAEQVEFLPGFEVADEIIKQKLIDFSLE